MKRQADDEIVEVNNPEDEGAQFWSTHSLGPGMFQRMKRFGEDPELDAMLPPPRVASVTVRFEGTIVERLLALASIMRTKHRSLIKEFVIERLYEEEKRAGLVGEGKKRRKAV